MDKPKRGLAQAFNLQRRKQFEFVSSLPLIVCQQRLIDRNEPRTGLFTSGRKVSIQVVENEAGHIQYRFERSSMRNLKVVLDMYLVSISPRQTRVYGDAHLHSFTAIILMVLTIMYGSATIAAVLVAPVLIVLPSAMLFLLWSICLNARNQLIDILMTTLNIKVKTIHTDK